MLALLLAATISANAIKAHIDFLASDQLEGRETGSRGFDIAAHYVASQFESIGLEPAGDDGTFFQKIEFRSAQVDESRSTMTINGATLVNRTDVIFSPIFSGDDVTIDAPIVFAGFGSPDDDAEKGIVHPFPLNVGAKIQTITKFSVAHSENVVARLKGKSNENVVVSAHLDHLGLATTGDDRVYNGALDNASGSAALIEIARAFAALPQKPARSIVFINVTGEEKGELGSEYFAKHPTVSPIVADVNMDMFTMLFP